ncbi:hypothetical protein NUU61_004679 [Penicillium alfredii]|uniref:Uncharacterized protein n=1 Tax=Penicillium alfredii TaxID=1506179 RepID=A0A9W9K6U9_9EURO|nr:uncharacterized protein NUU61_004679 [Penicillium alfredii]KAJ5095323.1 hypothetical protein NUU61_004679 [Penicillium alfredii]
MTRVLCSEVRKCLFIRSFASPMEAASRFLDVSPGYHSCYIWWVFLGFSTKQSGTKLHRDTSGASLSSRRDLAFQANPHHTRWALGRRGSSRNVGIHDHITTRPVMNKAAPIFLNIWETPYKLFASQHQAPTYH